MISEPPSQGKSRAVKCLVWDLDDTLWHGTLLEGDSVRLRPGVVDVLRTLDERGILHSIASKNDATLARAKLSELGIEEYFLCPQIGWTTKSSSIEAVAKALNIGLDAIAFIDDQPFERDEVSFVCPDVLCFAAEALDGLLNLPELRPPVVTEDSKRRRLMYQADLTRRHAEEAFDGPHEDFLSSLEMKLRIGKAGEGDLMRAEELTLRTNQLNTTGYTYSYEELNELRASPSHKLLMAELDDRYGSYGKVGLVLVECLPEVWNVKLLLMSCRVASRGVGAAFLSCLRIAARRQNVGLHAEFVETGRNRMMYMTYKLNGFREVSRRGEVICMVNELTGNIALPSYMSVIVEDE
jgi:FkbH-like protein